MRPFCVFLLDALKGGESIMTLNILFLTITIKKRKYTVEEILHQEMVNKIHEEHRDRQFSVYRPF